MRLLHPTTIGLVVLLGSCPDLSLAQTWDTPLTMHIYDAAARTIRPLIGVVGSSYLGPVMLDSVDWASIAPNQKSALVLRGGVLAWVPDLTATDLSINVGSFSLPDVPIPLQAIWSADSTGAVVLARETPRLYRPADSTGVVVRARETPRLYWLGQCAAGFCVQAAWDLDSSQTNWSLLAADSSVSRALVASQNSLSSELWVVSQTSPPATIAGFNLPAAAAFAGDGLSAYVADAGAHEIVALVGFDHNPSVVPSAMARQCVSDPVGLALSTDGSRLFLVDGSSKTIRVFQMSTGVLRAELQLSITPLSLIPHSTTTFQLVGSDQKGQPLFFLDTRDDGYVYFVPAGQ